MFRCKRWEVLGEVLGGVSGGVLPVFWPRLGLRLVDGGPVIRLGPRYGLGGWSRDEAGPWSRARWLVLLTKIR